MLARQLSFILLLQVSFGPQNACECGECLSLDMYTQPLAQKDTDRDHCWFRLAHAEVKRKPESTLIHLSVCLRIKLTDGHGHMPALSGIGRTVKPGPTDALPLHGFISLHALIARYVG